MPFLLLLIGLFSANVSAEQQWFDRHSEGWFWYESNSEPIDHTEDLSVPDSSPKRITTRWLRQNIGSYLDKAIDNPSKENIGAYLYLNNIVKEKAERFAQAGKRVIESNPYLDENVRRPISPAAAKLKDDIAYKAKESILIKIAKMAGLVFYYRGSCQLCQVQARAVLLLQMKYGFEIIPVSTDGEVLRELPNSRIDMTPPIELNILSYPALFLMQPPNNIKLIRQGALSFAELINRLIEVAYEYTWINEHEYSSTKITDTPTLPASHYINTELPSSLLKVLKHEK